MIFQLKLLAPVILLINSYLNPRSGNIFHGCLLIMATIGNVIYRFYFNFKVPYEHRKMKSFMEIKQSVMFYLFNPFPHLQPLIIGLWVGHLIITQPSISAKITSGNNRNRSMRNAITGCLALIAFFTCFFFIENMNLMNPNLTTFRLTMMLTLGRPMLVGLHAWIIYSCITGHISKFLIYEKKLINYHSIFSNRQSISIIYCISSNFETILWILFNKYRCYLLSFILNTTDNHPFRTDYGKIDYLICFIVLINFNLINSKTVPFNCIRCCYIILFSLLYAYNDTTTNT